jgi:hypothetical protein
MRRSTVLSSLVVVTLGLTAGACGGKDDDPEDFKDELIDEFKAADLGFTEDQAECSADILIEVVGEDDLKDIDFSADEPPEELADAFAKAGSRIVADCDIDLSGE